MKIKINDNVHELPKDLDYDGRLTLVNQLLSYYAGYFENNFELRSVESTLDILGQYLYFGSTKDDRKKDVLTKYQLDRVTKRLEIPYGVNSSDLENCIDIFQEQYKTQNPRKSAKKYKQSATHRLSTMRIPYEERVNRVIEEDPTEHRFFIKDGMINYEGKQFSRKIIIDCFTKQDLNLPFIDPALPYSAIWCKIEGNEFNFCANDINQWFKIDGKYKHDRVLCVYQNGNYYFFDVSISPLKKVKQI